MLLVSPGTGFVRNVPGNLVRAPATVISAGTSGIQTVANDGVNMITSLPANAIQFVGTGFRYIFDISTINRGLVMFAFISRSVQ